MTFVMIGTILKKGKRASQRFVRGCRCSGIELRDQSGNSATAISAMNRADGPPAAEEKMAIAKDILAGVTELLLLCALPRNQTGDRNSRDS